MGNDTATDSFELSTPVVFFVFNRPATTRRVLAQIRAARPPSLLVVADGPRADKPADDALCRQVREEILAGIDWPCDLRTEFAARNLGCGPRVFSGLQWAFAQVPEAIVLEDDCVPEPTFFRFCEEMLARHRAEPHVFMVAGTNFRGADRAAANRYFYSRHCTVWGWATWRRALAGYSLDLGWWRTQVQPSDLRPACADRAEHHFVCELLDSQKLGGVNTWDVQWFLHVFRQQGLSVVPGTNLISNVGTDGRHTRSRGRNHLLSTSPIALPLVGPPDLTNDRPYARLLVRSHRPPGGWAVGHLAALALRSPAGPWLRRLWQALVRRRTG